MSPAHNKPITWTVIIFITTLVMLMAILQIYNRAKFETFELLALSSAISAIAAGSFYFSIYSAKKDGKHDR